MFLLSKQQEDDENDDNNERLTYQRRHSRYQKQFHRALSNHDRRLRQRRIPRASLQSVTQSAWHRLYFSKNDQALITLTGLDHATFAYLLQKFEPLFNAHSPFGSDSDQIIVRSTKGRKRRVKAFDILGLVLAWTRTRGSVFSLQMHFGLTMTNLQMYLRFGKRIIVEVLQCDPIAQIAIPAAEKIKEYMEMVGNVYPELSDVWASMDGLKTSIQQAGSTTQQSYFYNGWKHSHFVTSVFCFCPDGTIPIAHMNLPGSTHDSTVADWGRIYDKLQSVHAETGAITAVDSAFRMRDAEYIIKSSQSYQIGVGDTEEEIRRDIRRKRQVTSMRQTAEWGMRAIQSSFPRLCDRMPFEKRGERRVSMKMMILLYNLRARRVGINQIRNFFLQALDNDAREIMN